MNKQQLENSIKNWYQEIEDIAPVKAADVRKYQHEKGIGLNEAKVIIVKRHDDKIYELKSKIMDAKKKLLLISVDEMNDLSQLKPILAEIIEML